MADRMQAWPSILYPQTHHDYSLQHSTWGLSSLALLVAGDAEQDVCSSFLATGSHVMTSPNICEHEIPRSKLPFLDGGVIM